MELQRCNDYAIGLQHERLLTRNKNTITAMQWLY